MAPMRGRLSAAKRQYSLPPRLACARGQHLPVYRRTVFNRRSGSSNARPPAVYSSPALPQHQDPRDYTAAMSMVHTDAVFFEDDKAFETWLVDNASSATHVWIRMAKKSTGITSIDWTRAVDVALCFGWIDGIARRIDDEWYVQRFTPRRAKSVWSKINRERIERLTAEGRMRPTGLAEVEKAKADGRWDAAYDSPATAVVPDDLAAALAARDLTDVYAALDGRNRFAFLNRIQTAVRPETRTRRIEQLTDALAQGKTPFSAPTKKSGTSRSVIRRVDAGGFAAPVLDHMEPPQRSTPRGRLRAPRPSGTADRQSEPPLSVAGNPMRVAE